MRVEVDTDLCQGHQMCRLEAPEVFDFDEDTDEVRILRERPDESQRRRVRAAVHYCPTMALAVHDD